MSVTAEFTKCLPKIELHAHLSGSISRECLHEIWLQRKEEEPEFNLDDPLVTMPVGKIDYDIKTFFPLFSSTIYHLLTTPSSLTLSTLSVLRSFSHDNIIHLELRTTPRAIPSASITKSDYISHILSAIAAFSSSPENTNNMSTYLILSIDRSNTPEEAMDVVNLALRHRPHGVVGIDLCGNPLRGAVSTFRTAFAKAKAHGLKITLHFAEVASPALEDELRTLLSYHPDRLGHVIHVPDTLKAEIRARKLALELCLSCNVLAKLSTGGFAAHHFGEWRRSGCPVILCTDDVGIFCSPLSNEYLLAAQHFGLGKRELVDLCEGAIDTVFGGGEEETGRLREVVRGFREAEGV